LRRFIPATATVWQARGCGQCSGTGYQGRFSVVAVSVKQQEIARAIDESAPAELIARLGRENGMRSLFECGVRHLLDGDTSIDELLRVTEVPQEGSAVAGRGSGAADPLAGIELLDDLAAAGLSSVA